MDNVMSYHVPSPPPFYYTKKHQCIFSSASGFWRNRVAKLNSSNVFKSFWTCLAISTTPEIVKSSHDNIYKL